MSRWVKDGETIWPRSLFDPLGPPKPGECGACGGSGVISEAIDEDRHEVLVPCQSCRTFCKPCGRYVKKGAHICPKA